MTEPKYHHKVIAGRGPNFVRYDFGQPFSETTRREFDLPLRIESEGYTKALQAIGETAGCVVTDVAKEVVGVTQIIVEPFSLQVFWAPAFRLSEVDPIVREILARGLQITSADIFDMHAYNKAVDDLKLLGVTGPAPDAPKDDWELTKVIWPRNTVDDGGWVKGACYARRAWYTILGYEYASVSQVENYRNEEAQRHLAAVQRWHEDEQERDRCRAIIDSY